MGEEREAQRVPGQSVNKPSCELHNPSDSRGIVVSARSAEHGVVMCPNHDVWRSCKSAGVVDDEVTHAECSVRVRHRLDVETEREKLGFKKIGCSKEGGRVAAVPGWEPMGELLDDGAQIIHACNGSQGREVERVQGTGTQRQNRQEMMVAFFAFDAYTCSPQTGWVVSTDERKRFE